jgi:hypothetical protein
MERLVAKVFEWALILGIAGQLGQATLFFANHAAEAQQNGLISLTALNHSLMDRHPGRHAR